MKIWPNRLGCDIGDNEVWYLPDGSWGIRTFNPDKYLHIHPTEGYLFPLTEEDTVEMCKTVGNEII